MVGAVVVALVSACGNFPGQDALMTFTFLAAALIIHAHRGNLARMRAGTEARARRLWLLGARR